jgi:hypothetical protein
MKKSIRFALIGVAAAVGLTLAANALPSSSSRLLAAAPLASLRSASPSPQAYSPELIIQQKSYKVGAPTTVGFVFDQLPTDDPSAKITIFSPAGYTNSLTQAPGTAIGKAFAVVRSAQLGGADLSLSGNVVVGNPADPSLMAASTQCRGSATNQAVWVLNTTLQGQAINVPDFVNVVGPYVEQDICLTPPATTPFQAQLWLADFTVNGVFTNASASNSYQWAADFTPYNGTVPNPAGTVESRTYVGLPSSVTFKRAKTKRASKVAFSGKLSVAGLNPAGIKLDVYYFGKASPAPDFTAPSQAGLVGKGKIVRTPKLGKKGTFTMLRTKPKAKTYFQARFENYGLSGGCMGPSPTGLPIPCLGEAISPMTSAQVLFKPARKKHK